MKNSTLLLVLLFGAQIVFAQQTEHRDKKNGVWFQYNGTHKINRHLSITSEIQQRNQSFIPKFSYFVPSLQLDYWVDRKTQISFGATQVYGKTPSWNSPENNNKQQQHFRAFENRLFQEITLRQGKLLAYNHRFRVEEQFKENEKLRMRYRYRFELLVPLNQVYYSSGSFRLHLYDEIILSTQMPFFDQNRIFGGLQYQTSKTSTFELGIQARQFTYGNQFQIAAGFHWNVDLSENKMTAMVIEY